MGNTSGAAERRFEGNEGNMTRSAMISCVQFEFVVCTIIIGILCILGITGNVTSFIVLWKHKTETSTVFLLQVLAVSDSVLLLASVFVYCLPSVYPYTGELKVIAENMPVMQTYIWPLALMAHTTTIWITVLVTLNRYCAICHAFSSARGYVIHSTKVQVVVVILFAIIYNTPRFFEHQPIYSKTSQGNNSTNMSDSDMNLGDSKVYQIIYSNILYFPVMYIVPLISLTYLNSKLIKALNALKLKKESLTGHKVKDDHITVIIIVIVFVFILCQTPALVNQIFWASTDESQRRCGSFHFYYTKISDVLVVFNSSVNFLIYCLFGKTFRRIFVEAFCKRHLPHLDKSRTLTSMPEDGQLLREL